ncbi:tannase/feruloyl esterase family alpha/beta hydrolase [Atopobiaceae bacterium HCP3S3_D6]
MSTQAERWGETPLPSHIPRDLIDLPTGGAEVDLVSEEDEDGPDPYWLVRGRILPAGGTAEPIRFEARLPRYTWNGRMLQVGGGGFDGSVPLMDRVGVGSEQWYGVPTPVEQGYVVYGSDSGHSAPAGGLAQPEQATFALDDEMLANFAHEHVKKVHDVVAALVRDAYGMSAEHSYFCGSSNGGREALKAAQLYPADFDGVIAGYPAIYWVAMGLWGSRCGDIVQRAGADAWIGPELWEQAERAVVRTLDGLDGLEDGLVCDLAAASGRRDETFSVLAGVLSPHQLDLVSAIAAPYDLKGIGYPLADEYPGPAVELGEPLRDDSNLVAINVLPSSPTERDGLVTQFADDFLSYLVMRDPGFDPRDFDAGAHADELIAAARLFDASSTDLDGFAHRGGKLVVYHGTYDQLIAFPATIRWFEALAGRYGENTSDFARLFVVPGMGHGIGAFDMGADLLGALDEWVCAGTAPDGVVAYDRQGREGSHPLPLFAYPRYARYSGGDPANPSSYVAAGPRL